MKHLNSLDERGLSSLWQWGAVGVVTSIWEVTTKKLRQSTFFPYSTVLHIKAFKNTAKRQRTLMGNYDSCYSSLSYETSLELKIDLIFSSKFHCLILLQSDWLLFPIKTLFFYIDMQFFSSLVGWKFQGSMALFKCGTKPQFACFSAECILYGICILN